jgi:hypothetical protein
MMSITLTLAGIALFPCLEEMNYLGRGGSDMLMRGIAEAVNPL